MTEAEAVIEGIGTWVVFGGGVGAAVAHCKGRDIGYGFLLGLLLGPMAFILYFRMADAPNPTVRKCPHCAELVNAEAKLCKHCGKNLPGLPRTPPKVRYVNGKPARRRG